MSEKEIRGKIRDGQLRELEHHVEISKRNFQIQEILLERKKLNFAIV